MLILRTMRNQVAKKDFLRLLKGRLFQISVGLVKDYSINIINFLEKFKDKNLIFFNYYGGFLYQK